MKLRGVLFASCIKPAGADVCIMLVYASEEVHEEAKKIKEARRITDDEADRLLQEFRIPVGVGWFWRQLTAQPMRTDMEIDDDPVIYTNDFSNVAATFTTRVLNAVTREQLATELRESAFNVAGIARRGSGSTSVESLGAITDYSTLTLDAIAGQLADIGTGQPGFHMGFTDETASFSDTFGNATSHAVYLLFRSDGVGNWDEVHVYAIDAAGNIYQTYVRATPAERFGAKYSVYFFVDVVNKSAEARFPYGEATEISVTLVDIPTAVFDAITDMRYYFGTWLWVASGYSGNVDTRFDEASVSALVVYTQTLTETVTLSDIVGKTSAKLVTDATALTDVTLKSSSITKTESVSLYDPTIAKATSIVKTDSIALTDLRPLKATSRTLPPETITLIDYIAKSIAKTLIETLTLTDYVTALKVLVLVLSEVLSLYDPTVVKSVSAVKTETVNLTDVYSRIATYTRQFTETTKLADVIAKTPSRLFVETVSLADVLTIPLKVLLTERLTLTDKLEVWKRVIPVVRALLGITPMAWTGATLWNYVKLNGSGVCRDGACGMLHLE